MGNLVIRQKWASGTHTIIYSEWLFKLNSKIQAKFQRKWGDDRVRGTQWEGDFDRNKWEWIRDYLAGCLGGSDEANLKEGERDNSRR